MKKLSRMTALMLALMLFITSLPITALAEITLDTSVWQGWVNSVKNVFQKEMETTETKEYTVPVTTTSNTIQRTENGPVTVGGADVTASLPIAGTVKLVADASASSYQWQVKVGDNEWANIVGDTSATMTLTYAKIRNVMSGNAVVVRCVLNGDTETTTGEATVTLDETVTTVPETVTVDVPVTQEVRVVTGIKRTAADMGIAMLDGEAPPNYSIVINYVFTNGTQAANPWTGSIGAGMSYKQEVTSPTVVGYTPDQATVTVDITSADKDYTYTVTYSPAVVNFKVEHWQQNVDNDQYTLVGTDKKTGNTESPVGEGLETTYEGFYSLLYDDTMPIAADGSTTVKIYYDRYYYLLNFDMDGGYGSEPVYARYGASIGKVEDPTKAGYTFGGWSETEGGTTAVTLLATMPAANKTYYAIWTPDDSVSYTIVYWKENADNDKYSYWGTATGYAPVGSKVTGSEPAELPNTNEFKDAKYFTFNKDKTEEEEVVIAGDGSSFVNVYYTRNVYTLKFYGYGRCAIDTNVDNSHRHSNTCYTNSTNNVIYVLTAKYEQDITSLWPTADKLAEGGYAYKKDGEVVNDKAKAFRSWELKYNITDNKQYWTQAVTKRSKMSAELCDHVAANSTYPRALYGAEWTYYVNYMFEAFDQTSTDTNSEDRKLYNGKWYERSTAESQSFNYSDGENRIWYKQIVGFTAIKEQVGDDEFESDESKKQVTEWLYYNRNRHNLVYHSKGNAVKAVESIMFEQPLKDVLSEYEPPYPIETEAEGAVTFAGWYTTQNFVPGTEFDFENETMPDDEVILYAKWIPATHEVTFYLDKAAYEADPKQPLASHPAIKVLHGALVDPTPKVPEKGAYEFIGWFYMDNGTEKAFDFANMQVRKDLDVYGKWSSNVYVPYTIKYVLEDGTEIAPATTGKNLAGTTKTFDAKVGAELNEGYQSGYFPTTNSHNMEFSIEGENTYSFVYIPEEKVPYTVKYLEKDTGKVLKTEKHAETSDAVITEKFEFIQGYAPDAYQKRLILSANEEENVIIFWYVTVIEHAPVQIIHWTQNITGDSYTEYSSNTILNGVNGTTYTETPKTIEGFQYRLSAEGSAYVSNPSGQLTDEGLVLNLYYDRIEYPYEFKFLEQGTDEVLATATTGNARYQAQVTEKAKTIPGYKLVSDENQAITIAIEDPANVAKNNVKIFYYQEETIEIKYQVVGPDGCGTLSSYADSNVKVFTGTVNGSTPTANENFRFEGWFTDEACTQPVDASWVTDNKIVPQKTTTIGDEQAFETKTYYAKFEYDITDLTITKTGVESIDANASFIFNVKGGDTDLDVVIKGNGSVTIKNLKVGTVYTVTEIAGNWRYTPDLKEKKVTLVAKTEDNKVTFTNKRDYVKWLDSDAYEENVFDAFTGVTE